MQALLCAAVRRKRFCLRQPRCPFKRSRCALQEPRGWRKRKRAMVSRAPFRSARWCRALRFGVRDGVARSVSERATGSRAPFRNARRGRTLRFGACDGVARSVSERATPSCTPIRSARWGGKACKRCSVPCGFNLHNQLSSNDSTHLKSCVCAQMGKGTQQGSFNFREFNTQRAAMRIFKKLNSWPSDYLMWELRHRCLSCIGAAGHQNAKPTETDPGRVDQILFFTLPGPVSVGIL